MSICGSAELVNKSATSTIVHDSSEDESFTGVAFLRMFSVVWSGMSNETALSLAALMDAWVVSLDKLPRSELGLYI